MEKNVMGLRMPRFRDGVRTVITGLQAEIQLRARHCSFEFAEQEAAAVSSLLADLHAGRLTVRELLSRSPEIAEQVPRLLEDLDGLRMLVESDIERGDGARTGVQLYREVRRVADRTATRVAKSAFFRALVEGRAIRQQLIGYALEYYWIVQAAPGLIGPALATTSSAERGLMQSFLKSELGHDRFLAAALKSVGVTQAQLDDHQPLPATLALCASLGVYGRQHPLSFKASLFLFERARLPFIDAFDKRCRELGLPEGFYRPLRAHADINDEHDHENISRLLMELEPVVDSETCSVVKRHVSIMVETMVQQEDQILTYYGQELACIPRVLGPYPP